MLERGMAVRWGWFTRDERAGSSHGTGSSPCASLGRQLQLGDQSQTGCAVAVIGAPPVGVKVAVLMNSRSPQPPEFVTSTMMYIEPDPDTCTVGGMFTLS